MADPTPLVYYLTGIGASAAVIVGGCTAFVRRQRARWTNEAVASAEHNRALDDNTKAARENTAGLAGLRQSVESLKTEVTARLDSQARRIDGHEHQLTDHERRLGHVEDVVAAPAQRRRASPPRET